MTKKDKLTTSDKLKILLVIIMLFSFAVLYQYIGATSWAIFVGIVALYLIFIKPKYYG